MAGKAGKTAFKGGKEIPRKHHCPEHDKVCQIVMVMPRRRMKYNCPQGHQLGRGQTVLI